MSKERSDEAVKSMATPRDEKKFRSLAEWVARGGTILGWCRKHDVSYNTAREWSPLPEFKDLVAEIRRESLDAFVGVVSGSLRRLAKKLIVLAEKGERSQIVQLQAIRAAVADMLTANDAARLNQEITELRAEVAALKKAWRKDESNPSNAPTA